MNTQETLEEVRGLSTSDIEALKQRARDDLYFLAVGILQYKDVNVATHGAYCRFIQNHAKLRRLGLMPRAHLKTTLASVADSVRLGLCDPDDCRVLIASETATLSIKILSEIKGHFEKNPVLRALFPELLPPRFSGPGVQWSAEAASLARKTAHKEPTWSAIGVGGAIVGAHFTRIKCDDLIGFEALRSPAAMATAKAWVEYIEPLLVSQHTDIIDFSGTRWARNDLYEFIMQMYGEQLAVFSRRAIEVDERGVERIIFPALHTWEEYERIQRTNPALWRAQYENNPLQSGNSDLPAHLVRRYQTSVDGDWVLLDGKRKYHIDQLDRVLTADPNSGSLTAPDQAAISVQGLTPDDDLVQLSAWAGRVTPTDFVDKIYSEARRWRVRCVGIEKAGQQNTHHYFQKKIEAEDYYVRIEELKPKGRKKDERVRNALEPVIRNGRYYVLSSQEALLNQIETFPDCILWDILDAAAYGPDLLRRPDKRTAEADDRRASLLKRMMSRRSTRTGY